MFKKILSCILAITLLLSIIPMVVVSAQSSTMPQNMLYIKTEETGKRLYQRVAVEVGQTYYFSFGTIVQQKALMLPLIQEPIINWFLEIWRQAVLPHLPKM